MRSLTTQPDPSLKQEGARLFWAFLKKEPLSGQIALFERMALSWYSESDPIQEIWSHYNLTQKHTWVLSLIEALQGSNVPLVQQGLIKAIPAFYFELMTTSVQNKKAISENNLRFMESLQTYLDYFRKKDGTDPALRTAAQQVAHQIKHSLPKQLKASWRKIGASDQRDIKRAQKNLIAYRKAQEALPSWIKTPSFPTEKKAASPHRVLKALGQPKRSSPKGP
jgi:hypothetical protein